jgi:hypothetical protein
LLPALYLAAALLLRDAPRLRADGRLFWPLALLAAVLFHPFFRLLVSAPSAFLVFPLAWRILVFLALAGVVLFFVPAASAWKTAGAAAVCAVMLGGSLFLYSSQFYRRPSFRLEAASRFMETLPAGSIIMGQEAPRLTLSTRFRAILAYENWFNDRDPFTRYSPDYLLVLDRFGGAEMGWIRRRFPEIAASLKRVRSFRVWDSTVSLYRVPR